MNTVIIVLLICGFLTFFIITIFKYYWRTSISPSIVSDSNELLASEDEIDSQNYNQYFLSILSEGDKVIRFIKIYNQVEMVFIQSLLYSSNIPSFAEFTYFNGILPTVPVNRYNDMYLNIREIDYNNAKIIVLDYLSDEQNMKKNNM
jgi:hypothetical protein